MDRVLPGEADAAVDLQCTLCSHHAGVERGCGREVDEVFRLLAIDLGGGEHLTARTLQRDEDVRAAVRHRLETADGATELVSLPGPVDRHRQCTRTHADRV